MQESFSQEVRYKTIIYVVGDYKFSVYPKKSIFFPQAINTVCDQTLFLGEEGEKLRWFLLPSEAAQLLNGRQLKDYPLKAPFTPLQWKNGLCVPQAAHLTGAHYMESSDRTSVAPIEKCTTLIHKHPLASTGLLDIVARGAHSWGLLPGQPAAVVPHGLYQPVSGWPEL